MIIATHTENMTYAENVTLFKGEKIDGHFENYINKGDLLCYTVDEIVLKCLCVCCYTFWYVVFN